ncbi:DUF3137 domain-containing protein [Dysgonomonas sp. 521]|uniref:DUF3137 domain-containing protein n=1 Tax=Dysgonomonas sp. 521 TaxID=2302932 RepID=UPI0013D7F060|nr:DUF3137 domain-containing protein [Dysgonomonas sp. 521]NDV97214.1 DUF3137 domain-containing protein [Dysgonomonas sp. 521]
MTNTELKELFLKEHKRDKKLTFINYGIICLGILLLAGIIGYLFIHTGTSATEALSEAFGGKENDPWYVKYIFIAVLAGSILYPFYSIWKLSKRPQQIDELMNRIESGARANSVDEYKEYKITIPLGKSSYKFCPVSYVMINLKDELKFYKLPLHNVYVPELKILLSGADINKLNQVRNELYTHTDEETAAADSNSSALKRPLSMQNSEPTPIKSVDEFKTFLNENLKDTINKIDTQRKKTRTTAMIMIPLVIIVVLAIIGYAYYSNFKAVEGGDYSGMGTMKTIVPVFALLIVGGFGYSFYMKQKYKEKAASGELTAAESINEGVFKKIIKFINPTVEYIPMGHIGLPEFIESNMFIQKNYDIRGNDQISGYHNGVPFIMCELWVSYRRNFTDEKESPDSVFAGQFFVARFNKNFTSTVYIKPKLGLKGSWTNNDINGYTQSVGDKVKLEDPEFMNMFEVYSDDQLDARYILTPSLMERIKDLAKRTKGQYYIAFHNNKITVLNNNQSSNFGIGYFESLTKDDNKLLIDFYKNISDEFTIIDDLKLNVRIWK